MVRQQTLRLKLPTTTLSIAAVALVAYAWPACSDVLVYERQAILAGDLWRLGTAVFVHFSGSHLLWDLLVFCAAGWVIEARDYSGFAMVCGIAAIFPGIFLLVAAPELTRYGGLSGVATAAAAYLCLCKLAGADRARIVWLFILVLLCLKTVVETVSQMPLFVLSTNVTIHVLPSVHAIGCLGAFAVQRWERQRGGLRWTLVHGA